MNLSLLNLPATTPTALDAALPVSFQSHEGGVPAPAPANPFAQLLDTAVQDEMAATDEPLTLPVSDSAGLTPPNPELNSDEEPSQDLPWPPDGLASLWLPAAPEPVQVDAEPIADGTSLATTTPSVAATDDSRNISEPAPLPQETNPLIRPGEARRAFASDADQWSASVELSPLRERGRDEGAVEASTPFAAIKNTRSETTPAPASPATEPTPLPQETNPLIRPGEARRAFASDADQWSASVELSPLRERGRGEGAAEASTPFAAIKDIRSETPHAPTMPTPSPTIAPAPSTHASLPTPAPASTTTTAPFPAPELHADTFPDTIGTHIHWLAEHKISHAHIQLNPQDMGPVEVRLKLDGDQLHADFASTQPEVRQALEHGLPRLRELLGEHGLNLTQADIGQQPSQRHSAPATQADAAPSASEEHTDTAPVPSTPATITHSTGLVDAYA